MSQTSVVYRKAVIVFCHFFLNKKTFIVFCYMTVLPQQGKGSH